MMEAAFPIGTVVAGRFRLDEMIAEGGMGLVYRATELRERADEIREVRSVAIKLIHPRRAADETYVARFERETETVVGLQHPNIVPVIDFGAWEGRPYIAFAWIAGEDLGARIARAGRLDLDETLHILTPVADALDAAHATRLVHRDIKPGNILLGTRGEVYLTDFGLARPSDALNAPTVPGSRLMGTAPFIAPEQLRPHTIVPELANRIDIYALACVAFACLTGEGPFRRDSDEAVLFAHVDQAPPNMSEARADLPAALDPVLAKALAKDPAERYATAGEFVAALSAAASSPIAAPQPPPGPREPVDPTGPLPEPPPLPPVPPRRPAWAPIAAAAGGLALILVGVAVATSRGDPATSPRPSASLVAGATPAGPTASAVVTSTTGPTPTVTGAPTPVPTPRVGSPEDQQRLAELVANVASDCQPRSLSGLEIAALACTSPRSDELGANLDVADYGLYETQTEIDRDWASYLAQAGVKPDSSSSCASGEAGESGWNFEATPDETAGRIACHVGPENIWIITWTDVRNRTWGWLGWRDQVVYDTAWEVWRSAVIR